MSEQNNSKNESKVMRGTRPPYEGQTRHKTRERIQHPDRLSDLSSAPHASSLMTQTNKGLSNTARPVHDHTALRPTSALKVSPDGIAQRKMEVNTPHDQFEAEAENVANRVMRAPASTLSDGANIPPIRPTLQLKQHRSAAQDNPPEVTPHVEQTIQRMMAGGRPLDSQTRAFFEQRMGADFSQVRIHTDHNAIQTSRDLSARAFTVGNHIVFNRSQYNPQSYTGKHLLAHELTHTIQQTGVLQRLPLIQRSGFTTEEQNYEQYVGQQIAQKGVVAAPNGIHLYHTPSGVSSNKKTQTPIPQNTSVHILATSATHSKGFYLVDTGRVTGWIQQKFIAPLSPDPHAELYWVQPGDRLENLLVQKYNNYDISTGNDFRTIMGAIIIINQSGYHINQQKKEDYEDDFTTQVSAVFDPQMAELRAHYQSIELIGNSALWLPSEAYIDKLKESGELASRSDWMNYAIGFQKGNIGFQVGIVEGFLGSVWDTLVGLYDLGKMVVDTIGSILSGEIIGQLSALYDAVSKMSVVDMKAVVSTLVSGVMTAASDFAAKWSAGNVYDRWNFRGKVVGAILLEVLLALATGGTASAGKWVAKLSSKFPKLAKMIFGALDKLQESRQGRKMLDKMYDRKAKGARRDGPEGGDGKKKGGRKEALRKARIIAETNDQLNTPVEATLAQLNALRLTHTGFTMIVKEKTGPNRYKLIMRQETGDVVDPVYTDGGTSSDAWKTRTQDEFIEDYKKAYPDSNLDETWP